MEREKYGRQKRGPEIILVPRPLVIDEITGLVLADISGAERSPCGAGAARNRFTTSAKGAPRSPSRMKGQDALSFWNLNPLADVGLVGFPNVENPLSCPYISAL